MTVLSGSPGDAAHRVDARAQRRHPSGGSSGRHATVGPVSLVMRGESVPDKTRWIGNPIGPWAQDDEHGRRWRRRRLLPARRLRVRCATTTLPWSTPLPATTCRPRRRSRLPPWRMSTGSASTCTGSTSARSSWTGPAPGTRTGRVPGRPPERALARGREFTVSVTYQGNPTPVAGIDGDAGWEEPGTTASSWQRSRTAPPRGSHATTGRPTRRDRIEVATATAYHVAANGTLVEQRRGASRTTWVFDQPEPMATYLATVHIGRYGTRLLTTSPVPIHAVRSGRLARRADAALARQVDMMAVFTRRFGPYPFSQYTVVVTDDEPEIPLEAQGIATFGANYATTDWQSERLVAHELAHQWFGNSLTVRSWRDIWLHEGFACYAEWLWSEESGGARRRSTRSSLETAREAVAGAHPGRPRAAADVRRPGLQAGSADAPCPAAHAGGAVLLRACCTRGWPTTPTGQSPRTCSSNTSSSTPGAPWGRARPLVVRRCPAPLPGS